MNHSERDRERAAMDFDPVKKARGYNSHPSGVETVQVTEHLLGMTATAVKYVWRRGEKWETQLVKLFRQFYDRGAFFVGGSLQVLEPQTLIIDAETVARAKRDAVIQDLEKALWCFEREGERLQLPAATILWDGGVWRPYAAKVVLWDGNTVLGRCLASLLGTSRKGMIEECCGHVAQELDRLRGG